MAYHHTTTSHGFEIAHSVLSRIKSFFTAIGQGLMSVAEANQRVQLVERLNAKSDAELAQMGIRREDIVRYVFRDMLHI